MTWEQEFVNYIPLLLSSGIFLAYQQPEIQELIVIASKYSSRRSDALGEVRSTGDAAGSAEAPLGGLRSIEESENSLSCTVASLYSHDAAAGSRFARPRTGI